MLETPAAGAGMQLTMQYGHNRRSRDLQGARLVAADVHFYVFGCQGNRRIPEVYSNLHFVCLHTVDTVVVNLLPHTRELEDGGAKR
jgi:hypothetical protein